jgi:hypothetical protein
MVRSAIAATVLLGTLVPVPARALVLPDTIVDTTHAAQLQTVRLSLADALMPMQCRTVNVRFKLGRYGFTPDRVAGAVASLVIRKPSRNAELQQVCRRSSSF